jgi:erythromycin esterase-like protein
MTLLSLLKSRPRLLALGEPTHGSEPLLDARNDFFRQLVEIEGYRTIALEIDCLRAQVVDEYVVSGAGTLDDVLARGFSHEWDAFDGNRDLVRWMRAYNDGRPASEQVRFAGFDGPLEITAAASPRQALTGLYDILAADLLPAGALDQLLGEDDRWTNPAAMMDPSQSIGRTPEAAGLRLLADDLTALLDAQAPQVAELEQGRLFARTAVGLLRYHAAMAEESPGRLAKLLALRDSMMAANLLALTDRGPTLVYAHNGHLQRDRSSMRMGGQPVSWWSAGAIAGTSLGDAYAFVAIALGTLRQHDVGVPPPETLEGRLYAQPEDQCVVDPRALPDATPRESPWFGYAPLDPAQRARIDGLVFVRDA